MATNEETELESLKSAVLEALKTKGSLNEIRAHLRSQVFHVCGHEFETNEHNINVNNKTIQTDENLLINQLIREYFKFNNYYYSLDIFETETGQKSESKVDRALVENKLGFEAKEENNKLPLLNTIVKHFLERKTSV